MSPSEELRQLRRRAQEKMSKEPPLAAQPAAEEDLRKLVHELQVHQIELEIQNEELCQAKEALEESNERFSEFYDFAPVGYFTLDRDGVIRGANLRGASLLGVDRSRLAGSRFGHFVAAEARSTFARCLARVFEGNGPKAFEFPLAMGDGRRPYVRLEAVASASGTECRAAVIDLSERRRQEEELLHAREVADAANQAKSDFLAMMSHEIRTPMNGLIGMTELALLETLSPKVRDYLTVAKASAKHLLDIINDVLDLAKIEARRIELVKKDFDLREAVESVFSTLNVLGKEKGLRLDLEVDPGVPRVVGGDPGRLCQVLVNVVGNAIKFTEKGRVLLSIVPAGEEGGAPPGKVRLQFSVTDTGIGIPADKLNVIFESFSQVGASHHARYGGTGLGLAITKQVVGLMGGQIWAQSEFGAGSVFRFTVELDARPEGSAAPREAQPEGPRAQREVRPLNILLAEDNPVNQLFAGTFLRDEGHNVVVAATGREVLEALPQKDFDVILMDVQMPEMDGIEAARAIREGLVAGVSRDIPIIALTAHALKGDRERFLDAGMDDYVSKPLDLDEIHRILAELPARKLPHNR